jgi:hypothetical protein
VTPPEKVVVPVTVRVPDKVTGPIKVVVAVGVGVGPIVIVRGVGLLSGHPVMDMSEVPREFVRLRSGVLQFGLAT